MLAVLTNYIEIGMQMLTCAYPRLNGITYHPVLFDADTSNVCPVRYKYTIHLQLNNNQTDKPYLEPDRYL